MTANTSTGRLAREKIPAALRHAETWIFDLDNTLYPAGCRLFAQIEQRMTRYVADHLGLGEAEARALKTALFRRHGTTMRGLMTEHGVDAHHFLDFVHEIDLSALDAAPPLGRLLSRLPGRKIVFTNGSTAHAARVLGRLGLGDHFAGVFDIVAMNFTPKPEPVVYDALLRTYGFDPRRAVMVEDMARNLEPAHALGMATVWVPTEEAWSAEGAGEHIDYHAPDLAAFLERVCGAEGGEQSV